MPECARSDRMPSTETALTVFASDFSILTEWHDRAKFVCRARHVEDPAWVRGAVPLLRK